MNSFFKIKDYEDLHYFLGLEFQRFIDGVLVSRRYFTKDLLTKIVCLDVSLVESLLDMFVKLTRNHNSMFSKPILYQKFVGKLNYLIKIRSY